MKSEAEHLAFFVIFALSNIIYMYKIFRLALAPILALALAAAPTRAQELVILHTNDTHSQIEPYTYKADTNVGGFLRREAYIREVRSQHPNVLLFDAGDFSQGTPYFNFFKGYTEVYLMNAMKYDAVTLGNHEFDNGCAALAKRIRKMNFPVVCANYTFLDKKLAKAVKPYTIIERDGYKVGVFGLTVDLKALIAPGTSKYLQYQDPVEAARKMVKTLQDQGCNLIVCLSHVGVEKNQMNDYQIAREVPGIDIIIGGHSHFEMKEPEVIGSTRIYQMTNKGKCIGEITINGER